MTNPPYYADESVTLHHGDALDVLRSLPDASVDAVVTDPPAGISFMGRAWDHHKGGREQWSAWLAEVMRECHRVAKPGAHAVVWALPRTSHWTACGLEDAGWEIRDRISHMFASGFPKSLDVSKAIDKRRDDRAEVARVASWLADRAEAVGVTRAQVDAHMGTSDMAGWWLSRLPHRCQIPQWEQWLRLRELIGFGDEMDAEVWRLNGRKGTPGEAWSRREVVGERTTGIGTGRGAVAYIADSENRDVTAPATDDARRWSGWGTALKPAAEDWWVARKPLAGTVAGNVLAYGTGALNIDASRVAHASDADLAVSLAKNPGRADAVTSGVYGAGRPQQSVNLAGRWPSNVVLSHAPDCGAQCVPGCPVAELDRQSGVSRDGVYVGRNRDGSQVANAIYGPRRKDVNDAGYGEAGGGSRFFPVFRYEAKAPTAERPRTPDGTAHPTVKPLDLMRWLVRLVTPPGGVVLEPFAGSGTTAEACVLEGFRCIAIEREAAYLPLIVARLTKPLQPSLDLFGGAA